MKARPRFVVCERISVDRRSLSSDGSLSFSRCFRSARGLCRDAFRSAVCYESACREGVRRCAPAGVGATEPELCEDTADPAPRPPRSLGSVTLKSRCLAFYFEFASRFRFFIYVSRRGAFPRFAPVRAPWPLGAARAASALAGFGAGLPLHPDGTGTATGGNTRPISPCHMGGAAPWGGSTWAHMHIDYRHPIPHPRCSRSSPSTRVHTTHGMRRLHVTIHETGATAADISSHTLHTSAWRHTTLLHSHVIWLTLLSTYTFCVARADSPGRILQRCDASSLWPIIPRTPKESKTSRRLCCRAAAARRRRCCGHSA